MQPLIITLGLSLSPNRTPLPANIPKTNCIRMEK
uniref:Uncharacterized protein n=1 Tax=Rhizophora mucronata TaxID=61149 RepID=A0A2P2NW29_RHIMU